MLIIGYYALIVSLTGSLLLCWAVTLAGRLTAPAVADAKPAPVTILKPLYGAEPRLAGNLATFLDQHYDAPVQIVFGIQRPDDPAIAVVERLRIAHPDRDIVLVVDRTAHGTNVKVSNLINMQAQARHDMIVLSDSDIAVDRDYLIRIVAALARPGVGAVSCLYRGRGDAGFCSALVAMGIDLHFLPATLIGLGTGLAKPCMGSTIALTTETLVRIGGFRTMADALADDYEIGKRVRALGLTVAIPAMLVTHGCDETTLAALWRHELRWSATVAAINPVGHAGSVVLHPLPFAVLAGMLIGWTPVAWFALALAVVARAAMAWRIGAAPGVFGRWTLPLIPLRDMMSFLVFLATFFVRSVDWRGSKLKIGAGRIVAGPEKST